LAKAPSPEGLSSSIRCRPFRRASSRWDPRQRGRNVPAAARDQPEAETSIPISEDDLGRLVDSRGQILPGAAERQRFSLAGAQDKMAVRIEEGRMYLATWSTPSSHILKFETQRWVCFAEFAANDLARRLGLPVSRQTYRKRDDPATPYLEVTRYDRRADSEGQLRRLHQEDITQAMGLSSAAKYEEQGGPGLAAVSSLLRARSADPVKDIANLRDWQLFNYLVGNSDGHAKNLALLYAPESAIPTLAPFYDLVCIEFLNRLGFRYDRRLAFLIGESSLPERVTRDDWSAHARVIGVPPRVLLQRLQDMACQLPELAGATRASFSEQFGDNQAYDGLQESIADRCSWTLRSVFGKS
jgi:serine/threonine-protein kinase HipA